MQHIDRCGIGRVKKVDPIVSTRKDGQVAKTGSQMEARSGSKINKNGTQKRIATRTDKVQKRDQPTILSRAGPSPWGGIWGGVIPSLWIERKEKLNERRNETRSPL